jgi:hypothetical protein
VYFFLIYSVTYRAGKSASTKKRQQRGHSTGQGGDRKTEGEALEHRLKLEEIDRERERERERKL